MPTIHQHRLSNGLWLVAEPIAAAQSLSMTLLLPAGASVEPADQQGVGQVLSEMICRGAGELDARAHSDALDDLGVQRDTSVSARHLRISATMIGAKLRQALPLLLDMARRPMLPESALPAARDLAVQALDALEDEPQQKVFLLLRRRHYPDPLGRSALGQREHIQSLLIQDVREYWRRSFVPEGAILGFAGRFDWSALRGQVEELLGDWSGRIEPASLTAAAARGYYHEQADSTQTHIGVAYDAPPEADPLSMTQRAAVAVLSGGMSGRLFTEVREKRGLCYAVYASYLGDRDHGAVLGYSGTTAARAQETLDVLVGELRRLSDGLDADEFERAVVGMKSRLVMQGESTGARAAAIAADQFIFGRPRTLDELAAEVDAVSLESLRRFVAAHRPGAVTTVTVGPSELNAAIAAGG